MAPHTVCARQALAVEPLGPRSGWTTTNRKNLVTLWRSWKPCLRDRAIVTSADAKDLGAVEGWYAKGDATVFATQK